jgi:ribonuclease HI
MSSKIAYYAVANGRTNGIFHTWKECSDSVTGFKSAIYKKFATKEEANEFIQENTAIRHIETLPRDHLTLGCPTLGYPSLGCPTMGCPPIDYYVYTDGACSNNGRANACAGIGIYFGPDDPRNLSKPLIHGKQTNNTAELTAIIETFPIIESDIRSGKHVGIATDSEYAIKCVTSYGTKCEKEGWTKAIPNKELVQRVYTLYKDLSNVHFIHVPAHTSNQDVHSIGNDGADRLANLAIGLDNCPYNKVI